MVHPESPIIDFYPIDFRNDLNGKKFQWQAVALLPFIDAQRLRASLAPLGATLTAEESQRNKFGSNLLFISASSTLGRTAIKAALGLGTVTLSANAQESPSFCGQLTQSPLLPPSGADLEPPTAAGQFARYSPSKVVGVAYTTPPFVPHSPQLLAGTVLPPQTLSPQDKPRVSHDAVQATQGLVHSFSNGSAHKKGGNDNRGSLGRAPGRQRAAQTPATRMILGAMGTRK